MQYLKPKKKIGREYGELYSDSIIIYTLINELIPFIKTETEESKESFSG